MRVEHEQEMERFTPPSPHPTADPPHPSSTNAKPLIKAMKDTHGLVWDTSLSGLNKTQAIDHTHFPRPGRFMEQMVL